MLFLLYTLHVLISLFLIAVVLLQQGKGADLSVFGGGATQTAFGARGAASVLHKLTVGSFVAFIVTTLAIGVVQSNRASSVLQGLPEEAIEETVPAVPAADAAGALPVDEPEEPATDDAALATGADATDTEGVEIEAVEGDAAAGDGSDSGDGGDEESGN